MWDEQHAVYNVTVKDTLQCEKVMSVVIEFSFAFVCIWMVAQIVHYSVR